jgi:tetratricopeptide (TPR) repeat protein
VRRVAGARAIFIVLAAACAPAIAVQPPQLTAADGALLRGCYDCLIEAREIYRRLARETGRAQAWTRVFEADLLIALREKELGLSSSGALTDARHIATKLPGDLEANDYIELVDAIPGQELSASPHEFRAFRATHPPELAPGRTSLLTWLSRGKLRKPVRDYLRIALECAHPSGDGNPLDAVAGDGSPSGLSTSATSKVPPDATLLIRYRVAICGFDAKPELAAVRAGEPRFVEASLFMARTEITRLLLDGPGQTKAHLDEALARFPASPVATYLVGLYHQLVADHSEALRLYDRTLGLYPSHDPALLGRVISLSNLQRAQDAIIAATQLVARGSDYLAEAYYWRARNYHALGQLDEARRDVSAAKELGGNEDLLLLAGMIEYEQGDLDIAQGDLAIVVGANVRRCEALWYLGLVDRQRKRWSDARKTLEDGMACYRARARTTAEQLRSLQARSDLDMVYRTRATASLEAATTADTRQQHLAALAAAGSAAAGDDFVAARRLLDLAAEDP